MRLGIIQNNPVFGKVEQNLNAVEFMLGTSKADLWLLPELFSTGYTFTTKEELLRLAEPLGDGDTQNRLQLWAKEENAAFAGGFPELSSDGETVYNSMVVYGPDGLLGHYRKLQLFADEFDFFKPGDLPLSVFEWKGVKVGMMICFDWRYPEVARTLALRGADLILHPANLVQPVCPDAMVTRSLENGVFTATADRWGRETRGEFDNRFRGMSQVTSPSGEILVRLGINGDDHAIVEIDPQMAREKFVTRTNHLLAGRRPEFYD